VDQIFLAIFMALAASAAVVCTAVAVRAHSRWLCLDKTLQIRIEGAAIPRSGKTVKVAEFTVFVDLVDLTKINDRGGWRAATEGIVRPWAVRFLGDRLLGEIRAAINETQPAPPEAAWLEEVYGVRIKMVRLDNLELVPTPPPPPKPGKP
jgi:hypothetical protein